MSYFDDILRNANGHLDVLQWAPPSTKWNLWNYTVKAQPRHNMTMEHSVTKSVEWKNDQENHSEKTVTKMGTSRDGYKYNFGFASDAFTGGVSAKILDGTWKINGSATAERKPAKGEWKVKGMSSICSPDWEGKRLWLNVDLEHNQKSEWIQTAKANFHFKDWDFGAAFERKGEEFTKKFAQAVHKKDNAKYFLRVDEKESTVGLGCSLEKKNFSHSYEGTYGWDSAHKGFRGTAFSVVGGGDYDLNEHTSMGYTWTLGEHFLYNQSVNHKFDKNWTVSVNQAYDNSRLGTKQAPYDIGFGISYKI